MLWWLFDWRTYNNKNAEWVSPAITGCSETTLRVGLALR